MNSNKLPTVLSITSDELSQPFRHRAALVKGGHVISHAESSLGGCRYLNNHLGRSCHAEVNACKKLSYKYHNSHSKGQKDYRL